MTAVDVVTFGESMGSIRAAGLLRFGGTMNMTMGGAESNVAIGLARLGHAVRWVGRLGDDEVGEYVLRMLRAESVDTEQVTLDTARRTGLMLVEKRLPDIARVAYYRAGSAGSALGIPDLDGAFDASTRILHVTGITPALSPSAAEAALWAVRTAKELGVLVSFDVNYRAALWSREAASAVLTELARAADIVFASDDELSLVADGETEEHAAQALIAAGVDQVVVKRGADGAIAWHGTQSTSVPARKVAAVDTIGAGDAFTAGYLSALLDGENVAARLDRGAVLGAFAVSAAGDWEASPTRRELSMLDHAPGSTLR
ncbi:MAG: sugar kinase [Microbacteriaceae bacterium]|nr:sugar kinase [Microbacteriaceae bacterium]